MNILLKINCLLKCRSWGIAKPLLDEGRNYFRISRKASYMPGIRPRPFKERKYMEKDKIPGDYTIIYRAPMEHYLTAAKSISTLTAFVVGGLAFYKYATDKHFLDLQPTIYEEFLGFIHDDSDFVYYALGFILVTAALRVMLNKYPLRIYRNQDKYIAIFQGQMPFSKTRKDFIKGEVAETNSIYLNPWRNSMYKMKDSNVILLVDYFKTPSELDAMLTK